MKSSSDIYPVTLLRADVRGDLTEDVYLIKHNLDDDKSVQIAVTHLTLQGTPPTGKPVILNHGSFTNRGFWLSDKGIGLARYLLEQGFDVWLYEQRGHGLSPRNQDYIANTLERYVLTDVVSVNTFVHEKTQQHPYWVGHSLGGVIIASAVAAGILNSENCAGQVLLGTQALRRPWYLWLPLLSGFLQLVVHQKGELDGRKLRIGPENEPAGLINEYIKRHSWFGHWQLRSTRQRLLPLWRAAQVPLFSIAAAADKSDPAKHCERFFKQYGGADKSFLLLSTDAGFSHAFGHVDMVVSKAAAEEVWPRIADWLNEH